MKLHKIRNVPLEVCSVEQKIAYNYAFMYVEMGKKILCSDAPEFLKNNEFQKIIRMVIEGASGLRIAADIDGIIVAFRSGFMRYCAAPFIARDFAQIGAAFEIPAQYCN